MENRRLSKSELAIKIIWFSLGAISIGINLMGKNYFYTALWSVSILVKYFEIQAGLFEFPKMAKWSVADAVIVVAIIILSFLKIGL